MIGFGFPWQVRFPGGFAHSIKHQNRISREESKTRTFEQSGVEVPVPYFLNSGESAFRLDQALYGLSKQLFSAYSSDPPPSRWPM